MTDSLIPIKGRGGARPGGGRPRTRDIFHSIVREAEGKIADKLPLIVDDILRLAQGQYSETRLEMEPAGTLYRDDYVNSTIDTDKGVRNIYKRVKVPMYPEKPPDEMVVTKQVETNFAPNLHACIYLMNRIMGPPQAETDKAFTEARTALMMQQIKANFYVWQAEFLRRQAEGKAIENEQWPKQFVSEEDERARIQVFAAFVNEPLIKLTPEKFAEFTSDPNGLENLKAYLGRSQADIFEHVMNGDDMGESQAEKETEEAEA